MQSEPSYVEQNLYEIKSDFLKALRNHISMFKPNRYHSAVE